MALRKRKCYVLDPTKFQTLLFHDVCKAASSDFLGNYCWSSLTVSVGNSPFLLQTCVLSQGSRNMT